jgi:hypothetical protein
LEMKEIVAVLNGECGLLRVVLTQWLRRCAADSIQKVALRYMRLTSGSYPL